MKSIKIPAIAIAAGMTVMISCSGRAASVAAEGQAQEATEATEAAEAPKAPKASVMEWNGGRIAPDGKLPMVIDFNADWCPPCRMFGPVFESTATAYDGRALFVSVNVDTNPDAARQFGVTSIPQVSVLLPDGSVTSTSGYMDEEAFRNNRPSGAI